MLANKFMISADRCKQSNGRLAWTTRPSGLICRGLAIAAVLTAPFLTAPKAVLAADTCLSYEPAKVQLSGKVSKKEAFGPPGYGEDPAHDSRENYLVLALPAPICVNGDPKSPINSESETDVREVQLVYPPGRSLQQAWLDRNISVSGTLFHATTGHHRTKVLIQVTQTRLQPAPKANAH
jgi:hypothetical protein